MADFGDKGATACWDEEADVVVVGFGGAGAVAAIAARDAGASVLILEKQSQNKHTPNTKMSAAGCHLASNAEEAAKYFKAVAFGIGLPGGYGDPPHVYPEYPAHLVEEHAQAWAQGVLETARFLKSLGQVELKESLPSPAFPEFPGAGSYGTFQVAGEGIVLFDLLYQAIRERRIKVLWSCAGEKLVTSPRGEVIGVIARQGKRMVNVKARKAVILSSGGFEYDEEMKRAFLPGWGWAFMGNPGNTGDGIRMGMGAGAALAHMCHNAARVVAGGKIVKDIGTGLMCPLGQPGRILVDNYGKRYINETLASRDPERYHFYKAVVIYDISKLEYPRIPSWLIFDETVRRKSPVISTFYGAHRVGIYQWSEDNSAEIAKGWILQGRGIAELARRIAAHPDNKGRMSANTLAKTIARFNKWCEQGKDGDFSRPADCLGPLQTPPYYAIAEYPGGPNTEGGLVRNARSQVLNVFGDPIPRLYAAGEIASVWSFLYQGGGNIAECIISGRIAGKNAAMEKNM